MATSAKMATKGEASPSGGRDSQSAHGPDDIPSGAVSGSSHTAQMLRRLSRLSSSKKDEADSKFLTGPAQGVSSRKPVTAWPVEVNSVVVSGNQRTKVQYFEKEMREAVNGKEDFIDLYRSLRRSIGEMQQQEIFEAIHVSINAQVDEGKELCKADIKVNVKEKGIPFLKAESSVRTSAATSSASLNAELQAALRNPVGYGEVLRLSLGSNNPTTFQPAEKYLSIFVPKAVSFRKQDDSSSVPELLRRPYDCQLAAKINEENSSYFLGFKQRVEALLLELRSRDASHRFELEICNRDEIPLVQAKSTLNYAGSEVGGLVRAIPEVVQNATTSTKVSLKYGFTALNTLDSLCSPSKGTLVKGNVELATPLGSAQFLKSDVAVSTHASLGPALFGSAQGLTLSLCSSLGLILPFGMIKNIVARNTTRDDAGARFNRGTDTVHLSDRSACQCLSLYYQYLINNYRYHLGGPMSLRGFDMFGVGDMAASGGLSTAPVSQTGSQSISATLDSESSTSQFDSFRNTMSALASASCRPQGVSIGSFGRLTLLALASVPVPIRALAETGAKSFVFVNAGVLGNPAMFRRNALDVPVQVTANNILDQPRISMGCGAVIPVANVARLEMTYSVPLLKSSDDVLKPFQFGVGLTIN